MSYSEYFTRTWKHIEPFFSDPKVRHAVWEIWYNRDFTEYASLRGSDSFTLTNWSPAEKMTAYIRKDAAAQVWNYGSVPALPEVEMEDPYESSIVQLQPDGVIGSPGAEPGQFQAPRMIARGSDGSSLRCRFPKSPHPTSRHRRFGTPILGRICRCQSGQRTRGDVQ